MKVVKRKKLVGWPPEAVTLHSRLWMYGGGGHLAPLLWSAFPTEERVATRKVWVRGLWDRPPIVRIGVWSNSLVLDGDRVPCDWESYSPRGCLAWLLLARSLPFEVPPAFAAKIREDFDCDLGWLCLADWLEEEGQPEHAAHLRSAVERSRGPG